MSVRTNRPFRDASLAVSLLTIVPSSARWPEDERTGVAAWFPFVGLIVGGVGWGAIHVLKRVGWGGDAALVVGVGVVALWALMTRMLHWDGLADCADGLWGGTTVERRLEIMADSHTGAFGATAIAIVALLESASIASITGGCHEMPLLVVPALARLSASGAAWLGKPARPKGLGRSVMGPPTVVDLLVAGVVVGSCVALLYLGYGTSGALLGGFSVILALAVPHLLSRPFGGVTGDVMGASVLICEASLFALAALMWGA